MNNFKLKAKQELSSPESTMNFKETKQTEAASTETGNNNTQHQFKPKIKRKVARSTPYSRPSAEPAKFSLKDSNSDENKENVQQQPPQPQPKHHQQQPPQLKIVTLPHEHLMKIPPSLSIKSSSPTVGYLTNNQSVLNSNVNSNNIISVQPPQPPPPSNVDKMNARLTGLESRLSETIKSFTVFQNDVFKQIDKFREDFQQVVQEIVSVRNEIKN